MPFSLLKFSSSVSHRTTNIVDNAPVPIETIFSSVAYPGAANVARIISGQNIKLANADQFSLVNFGNLVTIYNIIVDSENNIYSVGSVILSSAISVPYFAKTTNTGNLLWSKIISVNTAGLLKSVIIDPSGNVYVSGVTDDNLILIKTDSNGNVLWQNNISQTDSNISSINNIALALDNNDNIVVIATITTSPSEILISSYTNVGELNWQQICSLTDYDLITGGIAFDSNDNLYINASAIATANDTTSMGIVLIYDNTGALTNSLQCYMTSAEASLIQFQNIYIDSSSNITLTGTYPGINPETNQGCPLLIHTDINFNIDWEFSPSTNSGGPGIIVTSVFDTIGNIYIVQSNAAVTKLDATGAPLWTQLFFSYEELYGIALDSTNNVYVAGTFGTDIAAINLASNENYGLESGYISYGNLAHGPSGVISEMLITAVSVTNNITSPNMSFASITVSTTESDFTTANNSHTIETYAVGIEYIDQPAVTDATPCLRWIKNLSTTSSNFLYDTISGDGSTEALCTDSNNPLQTYASDVIEGTPLGFYLNPNITDLGGTTGDDYLALLFAQYAKFFNIVTYTGNAATQSINHGLGISPGFILIKILTTLSDSTPLGWYVFHIDAGTGIDEITNITTTQFTIGSNPILNAYGYTYVAYLFANDTAQTGLIQTGYYTGNNSISGQEINLGWEPQLIFLLNSNTANLLIIDENRGWTIDGYGYATLANSTIDQASYCAFNQPKLAKRAAGFIASASTTYSSTAVVADINATGAEYYYIAIRRGPMQYALSATQVFNAISFSANGITGSITGFGFSPDLIISTCPSGNNHGAAFFDKLRGVDASFNPPLMVVEASSETSLMDSTSIQAIINDGFIVGSDGANQLLNGSGYNYVYWGFHRSPGFFDQVCYQGNSSYQTLIHNLDVAPELIIIANRTNTTQWIVWASCLSGNYLDMTTMATLTEDTDFNYFGNGTTLLPPNNLDFSVGIELSQDTQNFYSAYLFASLTGISSIGTYIGNGTNQTINCGFPNGARFVLIKNTTTEGNWYVWDYARGTLSQIVNGSSVSPYTVLNSINADVISDASLVFAATGFSITQITPTDINLSGDKYLYFAIA